MAEADHFGMSEQLQIYQDDFFDHSAAMVSHAPMPSIAKPVRRPLQSSNGNVVLNPPNMLSAKQSPFKSTGSSVAPLNASQGGKLNMVSMMPPSGHLHSTDSLHKKQPLMSRFKTVAQKPTAETNPQYAGKENAQHPILYPAPPLNIAIENYHQKPNGKRVLLDAAPIKELRPAKKPRLEDAPLPAHDSFPAIVDDGQKPGHSYAMLIGMAILRSPHRRLTLAQIYKWISDTFSFYNANDAGWQNSIRHNLSLNKNFIKQERPKDDPGKGNYWAIEPGMEYLFMKEKATRKTAPSAENLPVMSTRLEPSQPLAPLLHEPILPPQLPFVSTALPALPVTSQPSPVALLEPSSDATIPVSDMAALDDMQDKILETDASLGPTMYSPLPAAMHSSPPIPRHLEARTSGTPPPFKATLGSSATKSRSHKRRFASMDDSGYISSLESSVMRPNQHSKLSTSEVERPRIKRGRAEEEIARLRASSYDSPTKGRSFSFAPPSSSPLRQANEAHQMLPPLTPAMKLKAPPKPPPSVSPGTNLRLHRENIRTMLESPDRRSIVPEHDSLFLTPGFKIDEVLYGVERKIEDLPGDPADFDIFQDSALFLSVNSPSIALNGSPLKRSAKRHRLDRAHSTSALLDITNSSSRSLSNMSGSLRAPTSNFFLETPSKMFDGLPSSPSKLFAAQSPSKMLITDENSTTPWISMDDLCSPEFLEENDFSGIDMLAGFEKIGSASMQPPRPPKASRKPGFGRSYTMI